ncbi:MAG: MarR family winged helix-turn-helix transcriptional regulator [Spongiibacteraceae bacterium]|jgi:DNA-binding MarR family transcriptional regulator|nr:MarR family winged helix-turn-helix transcriptional regulator [Spongiibacteraceae bacterium]
MSRKKNSASSPVRHDSVIDLDRYVPAVLTWIANKLSRGASKHYRDVWGVGIESWRCMVLMANEKEVTAQQICRIIGLDKASASRCLKTMQAQGWIDIKLDPSDGRLRVASLTPAGRALHDEILGLALERERALLSVLTEDELETLIVLLRRMHENLPAVEEASKAWVEDYHARTAEAGATPGSSDDTPARDRSAS